MIYKRGDVCWYKFRWTVKAQDGTRENYLIRKSARTANQRKARDVEEEHRRALRLGLIHPLDSWPAPAPLKAAITTVRQFSNQFLDYVKVHTKPGTARFYGACMDRVLAFAPIANAELSAVTGDLIGKYVTYRRAAQKVPAIVTLNGDLRTIRRLFSLASEWGLVAKAPSIHELPGEQGRDRVISFQEELLYLSKASQTVRDAALLGVDTGMRPNSEIFPLEWTNVHLECTQHAPHGFIHVPAGKTDGAVRNIPLTPRTREMLLTRRELMVGPKDAKRRCGDLRFIFPGEGNSGHLVTVQHAHEKAAKDAGLGAFEFYCWRHTFGTRCAESGMNKFTLARLMGHSSPRVAERYYIHVTEPHVMIGFEKFISYQSAKMNDVFKQDRPTRTQ